MSDITPEVSDTARENADLRTLVRALTHAAYFTLCESNGVSDNEWTIQEGKAVPEWAVPSFRAALDELGKAYEKGKRHLANEDADAFLAKLPPGAPQPARTHEHDLRLEWSNVTVGFDGYKRKYFYAITGGPWKFQGGRFGAVHHREIPAELLSAILGTEPETPL